MKDKVLVWLSGFNIGLGLMGLVSNDFSWFYVANIIIGIVFIVTSDK